MYITLYDKSIIICIFWIKSKFWIILLNGKFHVIAHWVIQWTIQIYTILIDFIHPLSINLYELLYLSCNECNIFFWIRIHLARRNLTILSGIVSRYPGHWLLISNDSSITLFHNRYIMGLSEKWIKEGSLLF